MNRKTFLSLLIGLSLSTLLSAKDPSSVSPWDKDDGHWITISGKISQTKDDGFKLNYGEGEVLVEMDGYRGSFDGHLLQVGHRVVVTGRVDADAGQKRSIEAGSVYVANLRKSFFTNADDEEEVIKKLREVTSNGTTTVVTGKVSSIVKNFMTVTTAYQKIVVSTEALNENAFDENGRIRLDVGDLVSVYGAITDGFSDADKLVAAHVVKR